MGIVTEQLRNVIARQIDEYCIVIWYDPRRQYEAVAAQLNIPNTTFEAYEDSFFDLRYRIDPLIDIDADTDQGFEPPRLLVYVPLDQMETEHALAEVEAAGVVLKPGQQPPDRNTNLAYIARQALRPILGDETTAIIEAETEEGAYSLDDLDTLAEKGEGLSTGIVTLVLESDNPQDIALKFLSTDRFDRKLAAKKGGVGQLADLMQARFDVELSTDDGLPAMRSRLAYHVLVTEFIVNLTGEIPSRLESVPIPDIRGMRDACVNLASTWRRLSDLRSSYESAAHQVEQSIGVRDIDFTIDQIAQAETFLGVEQALQEKIAVALWEHAVPELVELANASKSSFWSGNGKIQAHWALVTVAGQLLLEADRITQELRASSADAGTIVRAYTADHEPWCMLDTYHRHMESLWNDFDVFGEESRHLERLIIKARQRYTEAGTDLAERFARSFKEVGFRIGGVLHQTQVFDDQVKPLLSQGKTAYIWVDALRYEMARELANSLSDDEFDASIEPAIASVPTVTEVGMASLLPGAGRATLMNAGGGKLGLEFGGTLIKDRQGRIKHLGASVNGKVYAVTLENLLKPAKRVRDAIAEADLVLVTSQEIDALGEQGMLLARQTMDDVLVHLQRGLRQLSELGVSNIVLAADHGHIFGEELSDDMKIDAPGGETVDLHRRVWVGHGGATDPAYLRAKVSDFGLASNLEAAVPWNFACFKVKGGGNNYFHGGVSPQELIIPVLVASSRAKRAIVTSSIDWSLILFQEKLTKLFSIQITGHSRELFALSAPKIVVEVRVRNQTISKPMSASYGLESGTGSIQMRVDPKDAKQIETNTVTLMITDDEVKQKTAAIYVFDATTGVELARSENLELAIYI